MRLAFSTALLALLLSACSAPPQRPLPADREAAFAKRQSLLAAIGEWNLQARAAVRQGEDGGSVSLQWRQSPLDYELDISGPLGSGHVRIHGDQAGAMLTRGDERIQAASAETLLLQALGWSVPVPDLRLWVLGRPGSSRQFEIDERGRLARLQAGEWRVEYLGYDAVEGLDLPSRLTLEREGLRIRLAVTDWHLQSTESATGDDSPLLDGPFSQEFSR